MRLSGTSQESQQNARIQPPYRLATDFNNRFKSPQKRLPVTSPETCCPLDGPRWQKLRLANCLAYEARYSQHWLAHSGDRETNAFGVVSLLYKSAGIGIAERNSSEQQ